MFRNVAAVMYGAWGGNGIEKVWRIRTDPAPRKKEKMTVERYEAIMNRYKVTRWQKN